ncbi:hypothetical protein SK128_001566 [Halocaridina rubra]|uniref:Tetraspanin n=1 Tax=Halocaridina rubra TaxID=373956 RepID=A0AAN8ZVG3_HALRR
MGCTTCFRSFLSFVIILNMIIGLAIVGTLLWLYLDGGELWIYAYDFNIGPLIAEIQCFHYALYSLLILGAIKVFMSFIGCCSVSKKFFIPVLLFFAVQVAGLVCVYYFQENFTVDTKIALTRFVRDKYDSMNTTTDVAFDQLQKRAQCCGSEDPSDWSISTYNENSGINSYKVPISCCISTNTSICEEDRVVTNDVILDGTIHRKGCYMEILQPIYKHLYTYEFFGIVGAYILLEFIVMTLKVFACRRRHDDYEGSNMMELKPYR